MVDHCYYLIGFPVGHKWHGKNMKPRNKRSAVHNVEVNRNLAMNVRLLRQMNTTHMCDMYL